jgi:opacity protein-like surface antigen
MKKVIVPLVLMTMLPMVVQAESHGYISLSAGETEGDYNDQFVEFKDKDTAFSLAIGSSLSDNANVEFGYTDYGSVSDSGQLNFLPVFNLSYDLTLKTSAWPLSFRLKALVTESFDLYGRLGVAAWNSEIRSGTSSEDDSGVDALYGVGASFVVTESLKISLEYQGLNIRPEFFDDERDLDYSTFLLGAMVRF